MIMTLMISLLLNISFFLFPSLLSPHLTSSRPVPPILSPISKVDTWWRMSRRLPLSSEASWSWEESPQEQ